MSTRCALIVNERNRWEYGEPLEEVFRLYRHCDGYPEGMGKTSRQSARATRRTVSVRAGRSTSWRSCRHSVSTRWSRQAQYTATSSSCTSLTWTDGR